MNRAVNIIRVILSIPAFMVAIYITNSILGRIFSWWREGTTIANWDDHMSGNFIQSFTLTIIGLFASFYVYPKDNKKPIFIILFVLEIVIVSLFIFMLSNLWPDFSSNLEFSALSKWNMITGIAGGLAAYLALWFYFIKDNSSGQ